MVVLAKGERMPIDGVAAAKRMLGFDISHRTGACLYWVWHAADLEGADTRMSARTALEAWQLSAGKHPGDRNPPPGGLVWWGKRRSDGNTDGDVVWSLNGPQKLVASDQPTWGRVGTCTLAEREALIDREYLGWTDHIFDVPIGLPTPASDDTPVKAGDDNMAIEGIYKKFWKGQPVGKKHFLWLNKAHAVTVAVGPTRVVSGTVAVTIKTTTRAEGSCYVVEAVIDTVKDKKVTHRSPLQPHKIIPQPGNTIVHVPVPGVGLDAGERLRFTIQGQGKLRGKIVRAVFRAQQVKG